MSRFLEDERVKCRRRSAENEAANHKNVAPILWCNIKSSGDDAENPELCYELEMPTQKDNYNRNIDFIGGREKGKNRKKNG